MASLPKQEMAAGKKYKRLKLISAAYQPEYAQESDKMVAWASAIDSLRATVRNLFEPDDFEYYLIASSLYSSKIEGNSLDADSFFRNRDRKDSPKKKEVAEIEDLTGAYRFARTHPLNKKNLLAAHGLLSKTLLPARERGKVRKQQVGIRDAKTLRRVYMAVEPELVDAELGKLFSDIAILLERSLTNRQVFYYASMIHAHLAVIHPFGDGNGRVARLLEKWFLSSKLGEALWSLNSEKYYWDHRPEYYQNIALGYNYYALHWERCLPFLLMLPAALHYSFRN